MNAESWEQSDGHSSMVKVSFWSVFASSRRLVCCGDEVHFIRNLRFGNEGLIGVIIMEKRVLRFIFVFFYNIILSMFYFMQFPCFYLDKHGYIL